MNRVEFDRGQMTAHDDGMLTMGIALDKGRCVTVIYMPGFAKFSIGPRTIVSIESFNPEISLNVQTIVGADTFGQGVEFAMTMVVCLELLAEWDTETFIDAFDQVELLPGTNIVSRHIANAKAALMTVRATNAARRAG
jgi:hypothetical protein